MRSAAVRIAILALLVFAGVAYARGASCWTCVLRALTAAAVLYVVLSVAGHIVLRTMVADLVGKAGSAGGSERAKR